MKELFDVELRDPDDAPMSRDEALEAMQCGRADVLVPTTDRPRSTPRLLAHAGERLKLIANYGAGVDHIDVATAPQPRHPGVEHARRDDRGHRRHGDGTDSGR